MEPDLALTGVAAAAGVLGAGIGASATAWVGVRQLRADAEQERHRRAEEARSAAVARKLELQEEHEQALQEAQVVARILQADTLQARARLRAACEKQVFWSVPFSPSTASWDAYREQVARYMNKDAWSTVSRWFRKLQTVEAYAVAARELDPAKRQPGVGPKDKVQLARAGELSAKALVALQELTKDRAQADEVDELDDESDELIQH